MRIISSPVLLFPLPEAEGFVGRRALRVGRRRECHMGGAGSCGRLSSRARKELLWDRGKQVAGLAVSHEEEPRMYEGMTARRKRRLLTRSVPDLTHT